MAMNRSERERLDRAEFEMRKARALRYPTDPKPRPMTEAEIKAACSHPIKQYGITKLVAVGWFYNAYGVWVRKGCSDGHLHSVGETDRLNTQTKGRMFRTEEEAWRALRHELIDDVASKLASVDQKIEEASCSSSHSS